MSNQTPSANRISLVLLFTQRVLYEKREIKHIRVALKRHPCRLKVIAPSFAVHSQYCATTVIS